jgi:hypothetical protein
MAIQAEIGLNTTDFMKGVRDVEAATERMMKNAKKSEGGGHEEGFKFKGHKAEKGITRLGADLFRANSAGEALGSTLERAGKIFQLGLAGGVVAHFAGAFMENAHQMEEALEKLGEKMVEFGEKAGAAADFGGWAENISALKEGAGVLAEIQTGKEKDSSAMGFVSKVFGSWYGKDIRDNTRDLHRKEQQVKLQQDANREAALKDLALEDQIAQAKADGNEEEVTRLTEERKLKLQLLAIDRSLLTEAPKEKARGLARSTADANIGAAGKAEDRKASAEATQEEAGYTDRIWKARTELATLGEKDQQKIARLTEEIGLTGRLSQGKAAQAAIAERMLEISKLNLKIADDYNKKVEQFKAQDQAEAVNDKVSANRKTISDLEQLQRQRGTAGPADANRRLGLGGFASRGSDQYYAEMRRGNDILNRIATLNKQTNDLLAKQKADVRAAAFAN